MNRFFTSIPLIFTLVHPPTVSFITYNNYNTFVSIFIIMTKTVYFVRFEIHEYRVKEKGVLLVPILYPTSPQYASMKPTHVYFRRSMLLNELYLGSHYTQNSSITGNKCVMNI